MVAVAGPAGANLMGEYHAYFLKEDGHIEQRLDLVCLDDEAAKVRAKQLVDGHDVELWQLDRYIAIFRYNE